jgi:hypothetical protein
MNRNIEVAGDCDDNYMNGNEGLTVAILRNFPGCEQYDNEQAARVVDTLKQIARLLTNSFVSEQTQHKDETTYNQIKNVA